MAVPLFDCIQLRREGRAVSKLHRKDPQAWRTGYLFVTEERVGELRRTTSVARLQTMQAHQDIFAPLWDARLVQFAGGVLVFTGVQTLDEVVYAQSWMLRLSPNPPSGR